MSPKSNKTPLIQSGWNPRNSSLLRRYSSGFAKLKEMYANEFVKAHKEKITSKPLTKEEKNKIKEKIKTQIAKQNSRKLLAFIIALILTVLILIAVAVSMSIYFEI